MAVELPLDEPKNTRGQPDFDLIRDLAALLEETGLSEIEIGDGPQRVRVARSIHGATIAAPPPATSEAFIADMEDVPTAVNLDSSHPGAVISPLVGVAYNAPEPGAEPFITVGEQVKEGQTLFIVEAMKTMNPLRSPRGRRVVRILAENGTPVEYGEVLLLLE